MNGLENFLSEKNIHVHEGYSQQVEQQINILDKIISQKSIIYACEIGFNAGHSAEIILKSNPNCILVSFDLGYHQDYLYWGKYYIDITFPNRHHLILGDSTKIIPKFLEDHPTIVFDFIFIDGGHSYDVAHSDFFNCFQLSHSKTYYMIDDTFFPLNYHSYTYGPTKTLIEAIEKGIIDSIYGHHQELNGRGFSWGIYKGLKKKKLWDISDIMYPYRFYFGSDDNQINISHYVYDQCWNSIVIPKDKNCIFGDPCLGIQKQIFYKDKVYEEHEIIHLNFDDHLEISYGVHDKKIPIQHFLKKNCIIEIIINPNHYKPFECHKEEQHLFIKNNIQTWKFSKNDIVYINLSTNLINHSPS